MQGKLIVFEGGEGGGKTTQLQRIYRWLQHHTRLCCNTVVMTREPGGTALGQGLRHLLLNVNTTEAIDNRAELLLYAADRAQHVNGFIRPHLEKGTLILCDRFTDSTIAYQGYGRGEDLNLIDQLNQIATTGLQSDLTLWFDIDVATGLARTQKRGASDRIEQATQQFHQRVRRGFTQLAKDHPDRIVSIDASLKVDEVTQHIQQILNQRLQEWGLLKNEPV
ncbi:MAG: dTMP kinase [Microcoleaceae cyanobacterium]